MNGTYGEASSLLSTRCSLAHLPRRQAVAGGEQAGTWSYEPATSG